MQNQYFTNTIPSSLNQLPNKQDGSYQISPFGVVLQPVSVRTPNILDPFTPSTSPMSPLTSPMSPPQSEHLSKAGEHSPISLTPLSCGGFIYQYLPSTNPQSPPQPPPVFLSSQTPSISQFATNAPQFVSTEIAARQEKLEKYREKRARRNYNRPVDQGKRERACARNRDPHGHFAPELKREQELMRQALEASQRESMMLKSKLSNIEQELAALRQKAEEASASKQHMQKELEVQQQMNQALIRENTLLWSTVPSAEVFNTSNHTNPPGFLDAFKQKIDFSTIELNWTDSPHLEAARNEDNALLEQHWDEISFFGARS